MTSQARIRQALTALEARRLELERVISDDLERKFLAKAQSAAPTEPSTLGQSGGWSFEAPLTEITGFSSVTWLA